MVSQRLVGSITRSYLPGATDFAPLAAGLFCTQRGFGQEVIVVDILPAFAARRRKACTASEPTGLPIDGRDVEGGRGAQAHLGNLATAAAGVQLLFAHKAHA